MPSYVIVFFSCGLDSGRARFSTFKNSFVFARIRECMYAFEHWNHTDENRLLLIQ